MVWTEQEIIKKFNDNPKKTQISLIADLNGCSAWEVAEVLHNNGLAIEYTYKKPVIKEATSKRGRPKKVEFRGIPSTATKNDTTKESKEMEMPEIVKTILNEKVDELQTKRDFHQEKLIEIDSQIEELSKFMGGV